MREAEQIQDLLKYNAALLAEIGSLHRLALEANDAARESAMAEEAYGKWQREIGDALGCPVHFAPEGYHKIILAAIHGQGWQPIETAPKDETQILLWFPEMEARHTGYWDGEQWRIDYAEGDHSDWVVTHWMPLPPPPEVKP